MNRYRVKTEVKHIRKYHVEANSLDEAKKLALDGREADYDREFDEEIEIEELGPAFTNKQ